MQIAYRSLVAAFLSLACAGSASAQPIQFYFADTSGVYRSSFNIPNQNGFVDIDIYLNDTGGTSPFFPQPAVGNNLNTNNLRGVGFRVTSSAPSIARVDSTADVTPNVSSISPLPGETAPTFNFLVTANANPAFGVATIEEAVSSGIGVTANNTGRVLLGRMRFTAIAASGNTTLTFSDNNPTFSATSLGSENVVATNGGTILDPSPGSPIFNLFSNSATIFVGVPEPSSFALCAVVAAGVGLFRRRKRGVDKSAG